MATIGVAKVLGGCAVTEEWTAADGSRGSSLFYYVVNEKQWKQVWVTDLALHPGGLKEKHLVARFADGGVRFQGEIALPDGRRILDRTTLHPANGARTLAAHRDLARRRRHYVDDDLRRRVPPEGHGTERSTPVPLKASEAVDQGAVGPPRTAQGPTRATPGRSGRPRPPQQHGAKGCEYPVHLRSLVRKDVDRIHRMHHGAGADLEQRSLARDRLGTVDHQVVEPEALDEWLPSAAA